MSKTAARVHDIVTRLEWPTLVVVMLVYSGYGLLTWHYAALPWWLVLPLGGFLVAWHGSLQHEAVHGHPTPWAWVNELLVFPSLWLWLPFRLYRVSHLAHHNDEILTDPRQDPESFYIAPKDWERLGPLARGYFWIANTLAGRLLLEPARCAWLVASAEVRRVIRGDTSNFAAWLFHLTGCAVVLVWVMGVCGIPFLEYVILFAYPGLALTLLRSFLEHQARPAVGERSVLIEAGWLMSLLYLNNNLHALHHAEPGVAWYRLPARYREQREQLLALNGNYCYRGYSEIALRYLFRAKENPRHPLPSTGSAR